MTDERLLEMLNQSVVDLRADIKALTRDINSMKENSNCVDNTDKIHQLWDLKNKTNGMLEFKSSWIDRYKAPIITGAISSVSTAILVYLVTVVI